MAKQMMAAFDKFLLEGRGWDLANACGLIILITLAGCSAILLLPVLGL